MKKTKLLICLSFLVCIVVFFGCAVKDAQKADQIQIKDADIQKDTDLKKLDVGYIEDVTFDRLKKKERVTLYVSKASKFKVERVSEKTLFIKVADMFVPEDFRKKLSEDSSKIINYVLPLQKTIDGKKLAYFEIALKDMVPYNVREDKKRIVIDFDISALYHTFPTVAKKTAVAAKSSKRIITSGPVPTREVPREEKKAVKRYTGRKISIDFQDANINTVLRTLAVLGNTNIVSSENVKGNVTVYMKDVPWTQALDSFLDVNGLVKKPMGDVISVMTVKEVQEQEDARKAGEESRRAAELIQKETETKRLAEKGILRQISIEARIVEATTTFSRSLGVEWGGGYRSGSFGFLAGTNPLTASTLGGSAVTSLPTGIGLTSESLAVNFPIAVAAPTIGIALGGTRAILDAQLRALESSGDGKIISSPKVTTLDNVKATIKQGEEVPYAVYDKEGNRSINFKEAVLQLDAKPKVTPDGRISMELKATNDYADWQTTTAGLRIENPPIVTNSVESTVVVKDGDTIVVGGIYKLTDTTTITGVPGLSKIPILGWLFKSEVKSKVKREILIFITPRIVPNTGKESKL
jgi:type IV pilus assembly protein PilQ